MEQKYNIPVTIYYSCYSINTIFRNFNLIYEKYPAGCDEFYEDYFMGYIRRYINLLVTGGSRKETLHIEKLAMPEMTEVIDYIKDVIKESHKELDEDTERMRIFYREAILKGDTKKINYYKNCIQKNKEYKNTLPLLNTIMD